MGFGGLALRSLGTIFYAIAFACAMIVLGIFGYFMGLLHHDKLVIADWVRATTGISGVTALYTLFGVLLTCFLGAKRGFATIAIVLNILFAGAFIALIALTRDGAQTCSGWVDTPVGSGNSDDQNAPGVSSYGFACRLQKVAFAVSIIGLGALLLAIPTQFGLVRHHEREKRYGPSPNNEYTSGSGQKTHFWSTRSRNAPVAGAGTAPATANEKHF